MPQTSQCAPSVRPVVVQVGSPHDASESTTTKAKTKSATKRFFILLSLLKSFINKWEVRT